MEQTQKKSRLWTVALAAVVLLLAAVLLLGRGGGTDAWQEQYDLGMNYLTELDYEGAVAAFTAAIELDPKRAEAYVRLAETYMAMGDPEAAEQTLARIPEESEMSEEDSEQGEELRREIEEKREQEEREKERLRLLEEYDVVGFEERENYVPYEELTEAEQKQLGELVEATLEDDLETIREIMSWRSGQSLSAFVDRGSDDRGYLYTEYGDYRVEINRSFLTYEISIRPRNGSGCYISLHEFDGIETYVRQDFLCCEWYIDGTMEYYVLEDGVLWMEGSCPFVKGFPHGREEFWRTEKEEQHYYVWDMGRLTDDDMGYVARSSGVICRWIYTYSSPNFHYDYDGYEEYLDYNKSVVYW